MNSSNNDQNMSNSNLEVKNNEENNSEYESKLEIKNNQEHENKNELETKNNQENNFRSIFDEDNLENKQNNIYNTPVRNHNRRNRLTPRAPNWRHQNNSRRNYNNRYSSLQRTLDFENSLISTGINQFLNNLENDNQEEENNDNENNEENFNSSSSSSSSSSASYSNFSNAILSNGNNNFSNNVASQISELSTFLFGNNSHTNTGSFLLGSSTSLNSVLNNFQVPFGSMVDVMTQRVTDSLINSPEVFEQLQIAEIEIKNWCKAQEINSDLIILALSLWKKSPIGKFPDMDEIAEAYFTSNPYFFYRYHINQTQKIENLKYFMVNFGYFPSHPEFSTLIDYRMLHRNELPTVEQFITSIRRTVEFHTNLDEFIEKDKMIRPVANIDKIKPLSNICEEVDCSICLEQIEKNCEYFKLEPCGHYFHADGKMCLDGKTIIDWMKTNKTCPNCRCDIIIENKPNKEPQKQETDPKEESK